MACQTQIIRGDNGPESISAVTLAWAAKLGIRIDVIQPGQPQQNAYVERYAHGALRLVGTVSVLLTWEGLQFPLLAMGFNSSLKVTIKIAKNFLWAQNCVVQ